jgi:hypothetical protein
MMNGVRVRWLDVECELELDTLVATAIAGGVTSSPQRCKLPP